MVPAGAPSRDRCDRDHPALRPRRRLRHRRRTVDLDDEHAIVELEGGFVATRLPLAVVARHVEWAIPTGRPAFAQGSVAAVPAKLWIEARETADGWPDGDARREVLLLTAAAYAHDLAERLR